MVAGWLLAGGWLRAGWYKYKHTARMLMLLVMVARDETLQMPQTPPSKKRKMCISENVQING